VRAGSKQDLRGFPDHEERGFPSLTTECLLLSETQPDRYEQTDHESHRD
jgi:hypothetical protein